MSRVHILPLHLAQVGWGSLSKEDRNVPHYRPPTPGQTRNSLCKEALSYYRRDNPFSGSIGGLSLVPLITF